MIIFSLARRRFVDADGSERSTAAQSTGGVGRRRFHDDKEILGSKGKFRDVKRTKLWENDKYGF